MKNTVRQICWEGIGGLRQPSPTTLAQLKYDGSQYHLHIRNHKAYALTSKRISKKTGMLSDRFANFPVLKDVHFSYKDETIIVVEVIAEHLRERKDMEWNNRCSYVAGIMNSNPENVPSPNPLRMVAHDFVYFEGEDVSTWSYGKKLARLQKDFPLAGKYGEKVLPRGAMVYAVENIACPTQEEFDRVFVEIVYLGFEGCILKDAFTGASLKRKREKTADCFVIGFTQGKGKYKGQLGAVELGVFAKMPDKKTLAYLARYGEKAMQEYVAAGIVVKVGRCSGMSDEVRKALSKVKHIGAVVEVEYMQWTGKAMRHPRYKDVRKDKLLHRVTIRQFAETV
jgi:ATP-dependent DNA ligase